MTAWITAEGKRWARAEMSRCQRRFRQHINRPSNPRGRIHRLPCAFCTLDQQDTPSEAHHIDYDRPFVVVWVCFSHHRQLDHGSLTVRNRDIHDYSTLLMPVARPGGYAENRPREESEYGDQLAAGGAPF